MGDSQRNAGYLDFDLSIWAEAGHYFAKVINSPCGPSETVSLRTPFPNTTPTELVLLLENAVLRSQGLHRGLMSKEEGILREFGDEMFKIVFREPHQIAMQFANSLNMVELQKHNGVDGLRVKLRVEPPELAQLPWEYVYDELTKNYLCLRHRSPLVRFLEVAESTAALVVNGPLNILGMIANPGGEWALLDVDKERQRIDAAIAPLQERKEANFRWVQGHTSTNLLDMMQQESWHVFHFIGHGGIYRSSAASGGSGSDDDSNGFIVLGDGQGGAQEISATDLSLMLQGDGSLQLAVLNCCESGRGGGVKAYSSPGAALVRSGIPAVVAMQFPISDQAAIQFASRFYSSLASGYSVEKAVTAARVDMRLSSDLEWGIPVLFTRTVTGRMVPGARDRRVDSSIEETTTIVHDNFASKRQLAQQELRRLFG
jgi:CHAT domain-containing protein